MPTGGRFPAGGGILGRVSDPPESAARGASPADGISAIDTYTAGMDQVTAGYLVSAPRPALIECGPALSIQAVIDGLSRMGLDPDDLAYLVVSHVHLDHAGGAGDLAQAFPRATVVVSEHGARHLVDPEKLNASSRQVYGSLMDEVYGDCTPVPAERVLAVGDRDVLDLGSGVRLDLLYTPGHAKHHIAALHRDTGGLFVGDSVGVKMPGMRTIRPATPPPDFDLAAAHATLERYKAVDPTTIYLAHYGPLAAPLPALEEATDRLAAWAEVAASAYQHAPQTSAEAELDHVAETLAQRFSDDVAADTADPEARRRVELLSGFRSNAAGLVRYFATQSDDESGDRGDSSSGTDERRRGGDQA
jgi:glyoxylase-like metal-dependent hydrolase (beta-lactamase superfamily II)